MSHASGIQGMLMNTTNAHVLSLCSLLNVYYTYVHALCTSASAELENAFAQLRLSSEQSDAPRVCKIAIDGGIIRYHALLLNLLIFSHVCLCFNTGSTLCPLYTLDTLVTCLPTPMSSGIS